MAKIAIPLLNNKEEEGEFIENAIKGVKEVVLILVVDMNATTENFGFATSQISHGSEAIEKIKKSLQMKGISVEDVQEWGDTFSKINTTAKLKQVKKIVVKAQDNQYFRNLIKKLRNEKYEVEVIKETSPLTESP